MKHALAVAGLLFLSVSGTVPQKKPDFSGNWRSLSGIEQVVTQDDQTLTTREGPSTGPHVATYKLDGSESKNVVNTHGQDIVTVSKAVWDGNKLVITHVTTLPNNTKNERKQVWSFDGAGRLTIELIAVFAADPSGPKSAKETYVRK